MYITENTYSWDEVVTNAVVTSSKDKDILPPKGFVYMTGGRFGSDWVTLWVELSDLIQGIIQPHMSEGLIGSFSVKHWESRDIWVGIALSRNMISQMAVKLDCNLPSYINLFTEVI